MAGWEAMQQGAPDPFFEEGRAELGLHDTADECRLETGPECKRLRSAFHVGPTCACPGACALAASCCP